MIAEACRNSGVGWKGSQCCDLAQSIAVASTPSAALLFLCSSQAADISIVSEDFSCRYL